MPSEAQNQVEEGSQPEASRSCQNASTETSFSGTFRCGECDMSYDERINLMIHMSQSHQRQHMIHKCTTCHRKFSSPENLAIHHCIDMDGHFSCIYCTEMFSKQAERGHHIMEEHVKYKKVLCGLCECGFRTYDVMQTHLEKIHPEKKVVMNCMTCKFSSHNVDELSQHDCGTKEDAVKDGDTETARDLSEETQGTEDEARASDVSSNVNSNLKASSVNQLNEEELGAPAKKARKKAGKNTCPKAINRRRSSRIKK